MTREQKPWFAIIRDILGFLQPLRQDLHKLLARYNELPPLLSMYTESIKRGTVCGRVAEKGEKIFKAVMMRNGRREYESRSALVITTARRGGWGWG